MLEYGVAAIIPTLKKLHSHLQRKFSNSENEAQFRQQDDNYSQIDVGDGIDNCRGIQLDQEGMEKNWPNLAEEIKVMKKEITEMKIRMDGYANVTFENKEMLSSDRKSRIPISIKYLDNHNMT